MAANIVWSALVAVFLAGVSSVYGFVGEHPGETELMVIRDGYSYPATGSEEFGLRVFIDGRLQPLQRGDRLLPKQWTEVLQRMALPLPTLIVESGPSGRPADRESAWCNIRFEAPHLRELNARFRADIRLKGRVEHRIILFVLVDEGRILPYSMRKLGDFLEHPLITTVSFPMQVQADKFILYGLIYDLAGNYWVDPYRTQEQSPLVQALLQGNPQAVQAALDAGEAPHRLTPYGWSPLHLAATLKNPAAEWLLSQKLRGINNMSSAEWTPLHYAASRGNVAALRQLLANKPRLDRTDLQGRDALSIAVLHGCEESVVTLLQAGARPYDNNQRATAFLQVINSQRDDLLPVFLSYMKRKPDFLPENIRFILPRHLSGDRVEIVRYLLGLRGMKPDMLLDGRGLAMFAASGASAEMFEMLQSLDVPIHVPTFGGSTPLHTAALVNPAAVRWLIENGADVHAINDSAMSPLHYAVINNQLESIALLIAAGARLTPAAITEVPVVLLALGFAHREAIRMLVEAGATCDFDEKSALIALEEAFRFDVPEVFMLTLETCLSVDFEFVGGFSGWGVAEWYGAKEIQQLMIERGLPVQARTQLQLAKVSQLAAVPQPIEVQLPDYGYSMMRKYGEQTIRVAGIIDRDGAFRFPVIQDSTLPELEREIQIRSRGWRFNKPGLPEGSVGVHVVLPIKLRHDTHVWDLATVDTPPEPIRTISPQIPFMVQHNRSSGSVHFSFVINDQGHVEPDSFEVLSTFNEELSAAVREAILKTRYKPATRGGEPVYVRSSQVYRIGRP